MLRSLEVFGLRGFATNQKLSFAIPNGRLGTIKGATFSSSKHGFGDTVDGDANE